MSLLATDGSGILGHAQPCARMDLDIARMLALSACELKKNRGMQSCSLCASGTLMDSLLVPRRFLRQVRLEVGSIRPSCRSIPCCATKPNKFHGAPPASDNSDEARKHGEKGAFCSIFGGSPQLSAAALSFAASAALRAAKRVLAR